MNGATEFNIDFNHNYFSVSYANLIGESGGTGMYDYDNKERVSWEEIEEILAMEV